jgi:hypothetical protein
MSGAAGIAAAKNRRSKPDPNQKPIISCSSLKPGSCPLPKQTNLKSNSVFDEESLQIRGPMPLMHVLKVHEERLNKIDEKLNRQAQVSVSQASVSQTQASLAQTQASVTQASVTQASVTQASVSQACDEECYERISTLEEKVQMLEEVIMNLQMTLTNVQSFAMETSLAMLKLQNQSRPTTPPPPTTTYAGPTFTFVPATPVSATPVPSTPVSATPVTLLISEPSTED